MSTAISYEVPIAGPSPHLAMLRALLLKLRGIARHLWASTGTALSVTGRLPHAIATAVHSLLSTQAGYHTVTGVVRTVTSGLWGAMRWAARTVARTCRAVADAVTTAVGAVSPAGADLLHAAADTIAQRVTGLARGVDAAVRGAGALVWALAHTTLVRTTVTAAASTASAVFVIHTLSQGLLAVKIVQAMPVLMTAMVWATDPWRTLALVGATAAGAMGVALARLVHGGRQQPVVDEGPQFDPEPPAAEQAPITVVSDPEPLVEPLIDWDAVVSSVRVEIANDGSVIVVGVPNSVPSEYGEVIAKIATEAALKHWRRTRTSRPTPSRDDRRLFTKAAKEAVRKHARDQAA